jgi:hypothetical protein
VLKQIMLANVLTSVVASILVLWSSGSLAKANFQTLLVGVSEYPNLEKRQQLSGPVNDVTSYYQMLIERGVPADHIRVVADKTPIAGAQAPTKNAILNGLNEIEQSVRANPGAENFVFLLMAGHGSQMPAALGDKTELDGLDEIFLPRDIGKWDGEISALPNAISDNEIGAAITRLRASGAFVWAVFDNCHSGTISRGSSIAGEKSRSVTPGELGIPPDVLAAASRRGMQTRGTPVTQSMVDVPVASNEKGGFVAFYASQSYEPTPEGLLPQYSGDATQRGLFSYTMQQVLNVSPKASYRQVAEQIMQRYRALGRSSPTPLVEGSGLDATVFGSQVAAAPRQWPIEYKGSDLLLRAGQLQEITGGSILAVIPEATSNDTATLGYVEVVQAGTTQSSVRAIAYGNKQAFDKSKLASGGAYARPVELKVDFSLRVAEPAVSGECDAPTPALVSIIQQLKDRTDIAQRVHWVGSTEPAQVRLCARKNQVLFLDAVADAGNKQVVSIGFTSKDAERKQDALSVGAITLGSALERIGRAINLVRVATHGAASNPLLAFELGYEHTCTANQIGCSAGRQAISPLTMTALRDGDKVYVTARNASLSPVDFSALYVDANYGISVFYPRQQESTRIEPDGLATFDFDINADPVGREKLMFIAVPAEPQTPEVRFDSLTQEGLASAQSRGTRGGPRNPLQILLEEAAFGGATGSIRGARIPTQLVAPQVSFMSGMFRSEMKVRCGRAVRFGIVKHKWPVEYLE